MRQKMSGRERWKARTDRKALNMRQSFEDMVEQGYEPPFVRRFLATKHRVCESTISNYLRRAEALKSTEQQAKP